MYAIKDYDFKYLSEIVKNYFILNFMKRCDKCYQYPLNPSGVQINHNRDSNLPLVFLIGGVGGSGKSSFIDLCKKHMINVHEESTIDPCKQVVKYMAELEEKSYHNIGVVSLDRDIENKTDSYRSLLHDLKVAWCAADDGPNAITTSIVRNRLFAETPATAIFINIREPDQFIHLREKLQDEISAIVLTMCVNRPGVASDAFINEGDRTTMDFDYDLYISNEKDLSGLEVIAEQFCLTVEDTNEKIISLYEEITK